MAPIHHHFELKGWAEPKVIVRFWIISFMLALVALATLKVRDRRHNSWTTTIITGAGPNRVLVVGAGKTGLAVAQFCAERGASVTVTDSRTGAELHAARSELGDRVERELGGTSRSRSSAPT